MRTCEIKREDRREMEKRYNNKTKAASLEIALHATKQGHRKNCTVGFLIKHSFNLQSNNVEPNSFSTVTFPPVFNNPASFIRQLARRLKLLGSTTA